MGCDQYMKIFSLFIRILLAITPVFTAAESLPDSVVGTYYVTYYPGQSAGKLHSCSLVYSAMLADHAYKNGGLVNINGNIGVS